MARLPVVPTACRTLVVAVYLVALAVAGEPAGAAVWLGLALAAVWAAPVAAAARTGRRLRLLPRPAVAGEDPGPPEPPDPLR
ncbi:MULTISPECIES: hypothetical protein [unclassified Blastococcus]